MVVDKEMLPVVIVKNNAAVKGRYHRIIFLNYHLVIFSIFTTFNLFLRLKTIDQITDISTGHVFAA